MTVVDCSGNAALDMLKAEAPFERAQPMRRPILDADAIVLTVDASASDKQLVEEFQQFGKWLHELHEVRGRRADVADLPVYVVLTKCDLLAKPDDTYARWLDAIEEAKRRVDEKFREFLQEQAPGFGTVRLHFEATAIRTPALADRKAEDKQPLGVAELFRDTLQSARDFLDRRHHSQSRLQNFIVALSGSIVVLGLLIALLYEFTPAAKSTTLEEKALALLPRKEAGTVERVQGGLLKLQDKHANIAKVRGEGDFDRLPSETKEAVKAYYDELTKYIELYEEAQVVLKLPHMAKNEQEFRDLQKGVAQFKCPKEWEDTIIGRRADRCGKEFAAVNKAVQAEKDWLDAQVAINNALYDRSDPLYKKLRDKKKHDDDDVSAWKALKLEFEKQIVMPPQPPRQEIITGVLHLRHEELGMFAMVKEARLEWQRSKETLLERSDYIQERIRKKI
jgi:G3E family GTPase